MSGTYQIDRPIGLTVDPQRNQPLYRQIVDQVVERIRSGVLPPGYRLPPTRTLSRQLGTHRNTVVRAFEELVAGGWAYAVVGKGTFVAAQQTQRVGGEPSRRPGNSGLRWASLMARTLGVEPLGRAEALARPALADAETVNLSRMQASDDLLPSEPLRRCIDHVLRTRKSAALGYAPREGLPRLRAVIADELGRMGVPARSEDVLVTTGSQQALDLLARALIDPGDPFLVDEATYSGAINLLAAAGAQVVGVPDDGAGPDLVALERHARTGAKGLYLMPNSGNPTGACLDQERRAALVAWSRRSGIPLIEDDYGADLNLDGVPPPPPLRALSSDVVYVGTYSKKLIPALRVGFVVCPEPLAQRLVPLKHTMDLGSSLLLQEALSEFLERGYLRAHLRRSVPEYRARRDALVTELEAGLPSSVDWASPARGLVLWLTLPDGMDGNAVYEEAAREGVLVTPGVLYSASGRDRQGVRLTFCAEPVERIAEGARRLCRAIATLESKRARSASGPKSPAVDVV